MTDLTVTPIGGGYGVRYALSPRSYSGFAVTSTPRVCACMCERIGVSVCACDVVRRNCVTRVTLRTYGVTNCVTAGLPRNRLAPSPRSRASFFFPFFLVRERKEKRRAAGQRVGAAAARQKLGDGVMASSIVEALVGLLAGAESSSGSACPTPTPYRFFRRSQPCG